MLTVGADRGCSDIYSLAIHLSFLTPSLLETARYGMNYWLKEPLN